MMRKAGPFLMAGEVNPIKLVTEWCTALDRRLKVGLAKHESIERLGREHGGVARLAADQRYLAKEITTP